jgi:hypothetical protein
LEGGEYLPPLLASNHLMEARITTAQLPGKKSMRCGAETISLTTCHLKKKTDYK